MAQENVAHRLNERPLFLVALLEVDQKGLVDLDNNLEVPKDVLKINPGELRAPNQPVKGRDKPLGEEKVSLYFGSLDTNSGFKIP